MTAQKAEDVKDTALKLNEIRIQNPEDYFYLKGWIHCLLEKKKNSRQSTAQSNKGNILKVRNDLERARE